MYSLFLPVTWWARVLLLPELTSFSSAVAGAELEAGDYSCTLAAGG